MAKIPRPTAADWAGIWAVSVIGFGMFAFRQLAIVPRATVGLCAATPAPPICVPRAAVLWLQYHQLFGWAALILGLAGFFLGRRWAGILGLGVGIAAVENYNATTGMIGAAFGLITWLSLATGRFRSVQP